MADQNMMLNWMLKLSILLYIAINANSGTTDSSGAVAGSISLLVELHGGCSADIQGISYAIRSVVAGLCNCTVISSSLECCSDNYMVYQFNIGHSRSPVVTATVNNVITSVVTINSSIYSTDVIKLQRCYYGNCTCDDNELADSRHIVLILAIICGSLLILVLMTLFIVCYKSYRLHRQRRTVREMTKAPPIPSPRQIRLPSQLVSSCDYIAPEDVASPTFSPTLHQSNHCCIQDATVGQLAGQSAVTELNTTSAHEVECNINSPRTSTANMHTSIAHTNATCNHDRNVNSRSSSQPHGMITTASGLIAVIGLNGTIDADDMIPSQKHPGYVEHKINHFHSNNV